VAEVELERGGASPGRGGNSAYLCETQVRRVAWLPPAQGSQAPEFAADGL